MPPRYVRRPQQRPLVANDRPKPRPQLSINSLRKKRSQTPLPNLLLYPHPSQQHLSEIINPIFHLCQDPLGRLTTPRSTQYELTGKLPVKHTPLLPSYLKTTQNSSIPSSSKQNELSSTQPGPSSTTKGGHRATFASTSQKLMKTKPTQPTIHAKRQRMKLRLVPFEPSLMFKYDSPSSSSE